MSVPIVLSFLHEDLGSVDDQFKEEVGVSGGIDDFSINFSLEFIDFVQSDIFVFGFDLSES